jgi:signal transduction histidine kinase
LDPKNDNLDQSAFPRELESFFQHFFHDIPARLWAKDSQGRYVFVNSRVVEEIGVAREKWIGSTDEELFPNVGHVYWRKDQQVLSSGEPLVSTDQVEKQKFLFVLRFPLDVDGKPHVAALGVETTPHIMALIGIFHLQEQLVRNERMRSIGEMASGLAHDLSNSLSAASLRLRTLRNKAGQELLPEVDAISRSIDAASQRVQNLREYVTSRREENLALIDPEELIGAAIEMVDFLIQKTPTVNGGRIRIVRKSAASLPQVSAFPNQLRHVIANLLVNARDAMPDGGDLLIETRTTDRHLEIEVSDEGRGISQDILEKIFEPFFTTKATGNGLGLSMARDVMARMEGDIQAANRTPRGAAFTLSIPLPGNPTR